MHQVADGARSRCCDPFEKKSPRHRDGGREGWERRFCKWHATLDAVFFSTVRAVACPLFLTMVRRTTSVNLDAEKAIDPQASNGRCIGLEK